MEATLHAGAKIEILTKHELLQVMNAHAKAIAKALRVKPTGIWLRQAGPTPNAAGVAVIDFGGPPMGFEWELRRYFVTGQDPTTALAGSSAVVLIAESAEIATPFDAIDTTATRTTTTIPNFGTWTDDQVVIGFGANLLIRCAGLGVNLVFANAYVIQRNSTQEQTPELVIPVSSPNGKTNALT